MPIPVANSNTIGINVPNTFVLDVSQVQQLEELSPAFKELLIRLYQNLNRMCLALNEKTSGVYSTNQFVTSNTYFPNTPQTGVAVSLNVAFYRPSTRVTINFGALPNASTKSVPHGITVNAATSWVLIQGWATDPVGLTGIPIPYSSATSTKIIELNVDATNVNVTTNSNRTNYTITYIVLEFLTS
jgi:hypothetical protein